MGPFYRTCLWRRVGLEYRDKRLILGFGPGIRRGQCIDRPPLTFKVSPVM